EGGSNEIPLFTRICTRPCSDAASGRGGNSDAVRLWPGSCWGARPRAEAVEAGWPGRWRGSREVEIEIRSRLGSEGTRRVGSAWSVGGRSAHQMRKSIDSGVGTSPDVTRNHRQEGADARGDRNTHSAAARLWGLPLGCRRWRQHADAVDPADRRGALLR